MVPAPVVLGVAVVAVALPDELSYEMVYVVVVVVVAAAAVEVNVAQHGEDADAGNLLHSNVFFQGDPMTAVMADMGGAIVGVVDLIVVVSEDGDAAEGVAEVASSSSTTRWMHPQESDRLYLRECAVLH